MKELYEPMLYDASADETEKLRKRHEGLMEQLSQAEEKVRELNRMKVHESFAVTKLTKELLDECMESIEVHPGGTRSGSAGNREYDG